MYGFWPGAWVDIFFVRDSWVEPAIQLERGIAGAGIFRIIIGKFTHWQEPCLVILLVIDKGPEVGINCTILLSSLAVSLGIEGGRESTLKAEKVA